METIKNTIEYALKEETERAVEALIGAGRMEAWRGMVT